MRILIAALALVAMGVTSAWAASAYDDVPTDHWAYNALDYLTERGVLEGYPGGFFKGDRTLTRYEFAQAIARLLDTIEQGGGNEETKVMVDSLRAEFSDQLAQQDKQLQELSGSVTEHGNRLNDMEATVSEGMGRLSSLEDKVNNMKSGPDWKGEFRYRWRIDSSDSATFTNPRFRQQIMFKLGYDKQINEVVKIGFRLATRPDNATPGLAPGAGGIATSPSAFTSPGAGAGTRNLTLGGGAPDNLSHFRSANIYLDQAYLKYTPKWFGYYNDASCENNCAPKLELWAGIIPNKMKDPNEMIFDADINMQGATFVYHFNKNFQMTGVASAVVERAQGNLVMDDTYFFGLELVHNNLFICGLDAWIGAYAWMNEGALNPDGGAGATVGSMTAADPFFDNGFVHTAPGFAPGAGAITGTHRLTNPFSTQFFTVKGGLQYTFRDFLNKPFAVYGEYMVNTRAGGLGGNSLRFAPGTAIAPALIAANDDIGWLVGAQWGAVPTEPGQWYWFARYKEIGSDVIIDGFGDSDAGGANVNSLEVSLATMVYQDSMLGVTYFLNKMHNAYGYSIPAGREDTQTVQIDFTFKF